MREKSIYMYLDTTKPFERDTLAKQINLMKEIVDNDEVGLLFIEIDKKSYEFKVI